MEFLRLLFNNFLLILNLIQELIFYDVALISFFNFSHFTDFHLFNQLYLGDNGVYLLSLFSGYILIDLFLKTKYISILYCEYFLVSSI